MTAGFSSRSSIRAPARAAIRARRSPRSTVGAHWLMRPPPMLGEHNEEVLRDLCGLTDHDLARLASAGVIGTRPKGL